VVAFWGGELVSSPLLSRSPRRWGMPRRAFVPPCDGIISMKYAFSCHALRFLLLFIVLVIRTLESPDELLASMGGLPSPQSSRRGRRR
jgi:hypothetical protein